MPRDIFATKDTMELWNNWTDAMLTVLVKSLLCRKLK